MRCALECPIEARIRLPQDIDGDWFDGKRLVIKRDTDGFASVIRIEGRVADDDKMSMLVRRTPDGLVHFEGQGGEKIRKELQADLQMIESTLGLYCKLSRVRWEYAESIAIPETPEEEHQIQWNNLKVMPSLSDDSTTISIQNLAILLQIGHFARELSTTMSFFREGNVDMRTFRYITAFFSFYFVIEGLYGNGRFHGREVRTEFLKSGVLKDSIEEVLRQPLYNRPPRIKDVLSLDDFLRIVNKRRDVDGVIHMLVWARGDLHHFVNNPDKLNRVTVHSPTIRDSGEFLARRVRHGPEC